MTEGLWLPPDPGGRVIPSDPDQAILRYLEQRKDAISGQRVPATLADFTNDLGIGETTAKLALARLKRLGLVESYRSDEGRGRANKFWLTGPGHAHAFAATITADIDAADDPPPVVIPPAGFWTTERRQILAALRLLHRHGYHITATIVRETIRLDYDPVADARIRRRMEELVKYGLLVLTGSTHVWRGGDGGWASSRVYRLTEAGIAATRPEVLTAVEPPPDPSRPTPRGAAEQAVLVALRADPGQPISVSGVCAITGLRYTTVERIFRRLIGRGELEKTGTERSPQGRRRTVYQLKPTSRATTPPAQGG